MGLATEKEVAKALPAKFGIIIDGWSEGNQHYFGVYAAYDSDKYPSLRHLTKSLTRLKIKQHLL